MTKEDDYHVLSDVHNYSLCPRRWALRAIEGKYTQTWRTVSGDRVHARVHDSGMTEKRGNTIIVRGLRVVSHTLRICGECDVVEFVKNENGVEIFGYEGRYLPYPIEYKRGKSLPDSDCDVLQLCTQAMCLEEMLLCEIGSGALFYNEPHRRMEVIFTVELRERVVAITKEMQKYLERGHTPMPTHTRFCKECSLKNECLPCLEKNRSVKDYLKNRLDEV